MKRKSKSGRNKAHHQPSKPGEVSFAEKVHTSMTEFTARIADLKSGDILKDFLKKSHRDMGVIVMGKLGYLNQKGEIVITSFSAFRSAMLPLCSI